jgi:hypothetical protein
VTVTVFLPTGGLLTVDSVMPQGPEDQTDH